MDRDNHGAAAVQVEAGPGADEVQVDQRTLVQPEGAEDCLHSDEDHMAMPVEEFGPGAAERFDQAEVRNVAVEQVVELQIPLDAYLEEVGHWHWGDAERDKAVEEG